jgi:hypothetical protein
VRYGVSAAVANPTEHIVYPFFMVYGGTEKNGMFFKLPHSPLLVKNFATLTRVIYHPPIRIPKSQQFRKSMRVVLPYFSLSFII